MRSYTTKYLYLPRLPYVAAAALLWLASCACVTADDSEPSTTTLPGESDSIEYDLATYIDIPPVIDGVYSEEEWQASHWYTMDRNWIGDLPDEDDFSGQYSLRWDEEHLYIVVRMQDDVMYDAHPNPFDSYWNDDALEIFIDEDASGGVHTTNFNAFAYHVALDNQSVDIGPPRETDKPNTLLFNHHVTSAWKRESHAPNLIVWEVAVKIFNKNYDERKIENTPVKLFSGKKIGFMLAYCDNDGSAERESFIGSHTVQAVNGDKNRGYIDASVFDRVLLQATKQ